MSVVTPQRLCRAVKADVSAAEPFRDHRASAITTYLTRWYNNQDNAKRPLNLLAQAANILVPSLIGKEPAHAPTAQNPALRFEAEMLGLALDRLQDELGLFDLYRVLVFDALFSPCSVVKIGMRAGADLVKIDGKDVDPGQPYVARVDFDDWAPDSTARDWAELGRESHRYRVTLDEALESGVFKGSEDALLALPKLGSQDSDDEHPNERLGKGERERYIADTVELRDVVIYGERSARVVTIPAGKAGDSYDKFLLDIEYQGPSRGPYEHLQFCPVPNQIMGVPPMAFVRDIAEAAERVANKTIRQIEKAKQVFVYSRAANDDAMTVKRAADGDTVGVDDAGSVKDIVFGGADKQNYEAMTWMMGTFNNVSGALQMLGGNEMDTNSGTATEAQILQANATGRLREMQDRVQKFIGRVSSHLGWILTSDPLIRLPLPYRLPGGEVIEVQYSSEEREGDFFDFNFKVRQGSVIGMDPMVQLKRLNDFIDQLVKVWPLAQVGAVNLLAYARNIAPKYGIEDADEWINDPMLLQQTVMRAAALPQQGGPPQTAPSGVNVRAIGATTQQGAMRDTTAGMARSAMTYGAPMSPAGAA